MAYPALYVEILRAAGLALAPLIRRFISLGLNRMWLHSGDTIYRCGSATSCNVNRQVSRRQQTS